jgi:hypothetical protein
MKKARVLAGIAALTPAAIALVTEWEVVSK